MVDRAFLKTLTEVPSVGTACNPVLNLLTDWFDRGYTRTMASDGFCLFQKAGASPDALKAVLVSHVDEVGGCVYGVRPEGGFFSRVWGNTPQIFAEAELQAWDYVADDAKGAYPVRGEVVTIQDEERFVLHGDNIRPYRTAWTFRQETTYDGDSIYGKALDPRVTAYAVAEAVRRIDSPAIGALFVMAEECAMDVARKAVTFLSRNSPKLRLVVNADVPLIHNLGDGDLERPAIRIFEGRNFIDPSFGIHVADEMERQGVEFHLSAARSGSQTILFTPIASTLSVALPSDGIHLPRYRMSLKGVERCITLLQSLGEGALSGKF